MKKRIIRNDNVDERRDDLTAVEVDRAICLHRCYGVSYGAIYLYQRGIAFRVALRVLVTGRRRIRDRHYLAVPRPQGEPHFSNDDIYSK